MDISVIVPFYNAEAFVEECLRGLLAQSYPREAYEIIFIDNNSTDASAEIVRRHPRVKLLSESKQGAYAARNRGLAEAQGPILAFTDPDCVPDRHWLRHLASAMQAPDVHIVIGGYQQPPHPLLALLSRYEHEKDRYIFSSNLRTLYYGHTNNMAVHRALFDALGPFVERSRGADAIFVRQAVDDFSCDIARYCPKARVRHLEVDSLRAYYRKMYTYGRSRQRFRDVAQIRHLNNKERRLVFRRTVQSESYPLIASAALFLLLAGGLMSWKAGRWSAGTNLQGIKETEATHGYGTNVEIKSRPLIRSGDAGSV